MIFLILWKSVMVVDSLLVPWILRGVEWKQKATGPT